ncbi:hypothetical protein [Geoalkalibacter sp.]|uniref:hypothetical protein n=1 Tax=Geoalkalibacter sp. TaxID=3041440 RepID=UPI00272E5808|nr:hypothetical protein [Geoalkalibacter sp.]
MVDQVIVTLIGALISGIFSLLAAAVPYYLQRKKSKPQHVQEILNQRFYSTWPWYAVFSVFLTLFFQFFFALVLFYGAFGGFIIAAAQTEDINNFLAGFDLAKSVDVLNWLQSIDLYISPVFNAIVVLFVIKFCSHRFGKKKLIKSLIMAFLSTVVYFAIIYSFSDPAVNSMTYAIKEFLVTLLLSLSAAYAGCVWARKTHTIFLISSISSILDERDRLALLDLASSAAAQSSGHSQIKM